MENVKVNAVNFEAISALCKLKIQTEEQTYKQQKPGILFYFLKFGKEILK